MFRRPALLLGHQRAVAVAKPPSFGNNDESKLFSSLFLAQHRLSQAGTVVRFVHLLVSRSTVALRTISVYLCIT